MAQNNFGSFLQNERERKGLDVTTVARRLRIRPDILQAIESGDFNRMPPRGYARNMVNAYARFLGLNPTEVTKMYLDAAYADEVRRARSSAQSNGFDMSRAGSSRRKSRREIEEEEFTTENGRMLYVDNNTSRYRDQRQGDRVYSEEQTHRTNRSAVPGQQYTNFYAGPNKMAGTQSRIPLFIGIAVVIILIIVLAIFFFGPKGDDSNTENIPVTGGATANQSDVVTPDDTATSTPVAPTQVQIAYEIADGQSAYIEVYLNNSTTPEEAATVEGPATKTYQVSGVLRIVTTNPDGIKVTQDGTPLTWTDDNNNGVYTITVDFAAILAQWYVDNPTAAQSTGGDGTTADTGNGTADTGTSTQ